MLVVVSLIKWLHYRPFPGELPTISEHSKETFFLESVFDNVRNCGLQAYNVGKKRTNSQRFVWNFWVLKSCVLIKKWIQERQFFEVLGNEIIPAKCLWWILVLVTNCNISKDRLVHICCLSGYCEKMLCFKHVVMVFNFS